MAILLSLNLFINLGTKVYKFFSIIISGRQIILFIILIVVKQILKFLSSINYNKNSMIWGTCAFNSFYVLLLLVYYVI